VFFFVIDWLGGTPLFASRVMRRAGEISLDLITLKPLRRLADRRRARLRTSKRAAPAPSEPMLQE
jgi:hypothetical protein